ncbi:MAG: cobyrinate a,c-diamide synthase [Chloroflexota bacterium]
MRENRPGANGGGWPARFVISAPQGQSGKTTVSLGLCAAFARQGLAVQPFKKGPDYIDPSWLTAAAKRACRNLDLFLIPEDKLLLSFQQASRGCDLALIEGAMGLYDSPDLSGKESTAQLARRLEAPVILIVNTARMTRSVAALISGYQHFEPDTNISGVILNNVSGNRHESKLKAAIQQYCGIPVFGSLPRDAKLKITERHLGLIPYIEAEQAAAIVEHTREMVEAHLDLDGILTIARRSPAHPTSDTGLPAAKPTITRIGVILDRVFNFYYPENLEALVQAGAELVFIDSLHDQKLPAIDGLYIGGGFPELALTELEANRALRQNLAQLISDGLPVYAECAGLMYLSRAIRWHGARHEMVGVLPGEVEMCLRPQGHGYVKAKVIADNPFFSVGTEIRGHQFHYSRLVATDGLEFAYRVHDSQGKDAQCDGIMYNNVMASYTHLHALSMPQWAERFVALTSKSPIGKLSAGNK